MLSLSRTEELFAETVGRLSYCNPFLPERMDLEREALGEHYQPQEAYWSRVDDSVSTSPNVMMLVQRATALADKIRDALLSKPRTDQRYLRLYREVVEFVLFHRFHLKFLQLIESGDEPTHKPRRVGFYREFLREHDHYVSLPSITSGLLHDSDPAHLFACFFQVRRAFQFIFEYFLGDSLPAARLRAAAWQSVFTHDMRLYRQSLFNRMGDVSTLIVGPSGTGKELVARAIALSRYIPFNAETGSFSEEFSSGFIPLNLSALSPTLIESELFGHLRGAFTGALSDRIGWLESCPERGTVFLDEVGDVEVSIQVKLLRVLEARSFQRIGDTTARAFRGKVIAATHKNLTTEINEGRFREDFYYRLCSDVIRTPSLREQLDDSPQSLAVLVRFLAARLVGMEQVDAVSSNVVDWIENNISPAYPWPGNVRELEQCVRNVVIRGSYTPPSMESKSPDLKLLAQMRAASLTAEEVLQAYCAMAYELTGSYRQTAHRLALDQRTVKDKVEKASAPRIAKPHS